MKRSFEKMIKLILRTYGGIFESPKNINENFLSKTLGIPFSIFIENLKQLQEDEIISFYHANTNAQIRFLLPREDNRTINNFSRGIEQRNNLKLKKMNALMDFIENDSICRNMQLLNYFNELKPTKCGICDVCISNNSDKNIGSLSIANSIVELLKQEKELSSKEMVLRIGNKEQDIIFCLQLLLEKNRIHVTSRNKFRLLD